MSQFHSDCRRTKSVSWQIYLNVAYIKHFSSLSLDFSHSSKRRWEIEVFQLSRAYHANKDVFASVILVHEEIIFAILVDVLCIFKLKWLFNVICCDSPPRSSWETRKRQKETGSPPFEIPSHIIHEKPWTYDHGNRDKRGESMFSAAVPAPKRRLFPSTETGKRKAVNAFV